MHKPMHQNTRRKHKSTFLKPFHYIYAFITGIPYEIRSRKVQRIKKIKERVSEFID